MPRSSSDVGSVSGQDIPDLDILDIVMDPHYRQDGGYPLKPSLMSKTSDDDWKTGHWKLNTGENMQASHQLQQNPLARPIYPLQHGTPPLKYSTSQKVYSDFFTDEESEGPFAVSSPIQWMGCQVNDTPALRTQHRVQFSHQQRQLGNMGYQPSSAIPNHATTHCAACPCQHSLGVTVPGAQSHSAQSVAQQQAFILSPPPLSQQSYSPSTSGCASPQLSPSFAFAPLPSPESSTPAEIQLPTDTQSPVDNKRQFICNACNMVKKDFKSLDRHFLERHCRPPDREAQQGWFRCACGYTSCYYRKGNHARHLEKCKPHKWVLREFVCQCLFKHTDKDIHAAHYKACSIGRRRAGRPRAA